MRDCIAAGTWRGCVKIPLDARLHFVAVGSGRAVTIQYDTTRDVILTIDVKKRSNKKNVKNVKNRTKIKKNVCKRNKKRYLFSV